MLNNKSLMMEESKGLIISRMELQIFSKSRASRFTLVEDISLLLFSSSFGPRPAIFNTLLTIYVRIELVINHLFTAVFASAKAMIPFNLLFASALIFCSKAMSTP